MARILVVEDASTVRLFHSQILEERGHDTEVAMNGAEALEKVLASGYDLLLVDVNMPKMDGFTLLRTLRGDPALCDVPAVIITTEARPQDLADAFAAGANYFMTKPVQAQELATVVALLAGEPMP